MVELLPIRAADHITGMMSAASIFAPHLAYASEERLAVAHLDIDQRILSFTVSSDAHSDRVEAPIRTIVIEALACGATSLIIAHNHPSGLALPSAADREMTRLLIRTLRPLGLSLQDHLIFAGQDWTSLRGLGVI
jgi:DNA repair protein RadC